MVDTIRSIRGIIVDGMTIMVGGFGGTGFPRRIVSEIAQLDIKGLHIITNDTGSDDAGIGALVENGQVEKLTCSYTAQNSTSLKGIEIDMVRQGILAERIRAAGCGIEFFSIEGLLYYPLRADVAIVKAHASDRYGNLIYLGTEKNFNPVMATAGQVVLADVDQFSRNPFRPWRIETSGIYIDYLYA